MYTHQLTSVAIPSRVITCVYTISLGRIQSAELLHALVDDARSLPATMHTRAPTSGTTTQTPSFTKHVRQCCQQEHTNISAYRVSPVSCAAPTWLPAIPGGIHSSHSNHTTSTRLYCDRQIGFSPVPYEHVCVCVCVCQKVSTDG
jgi:hypothetical protein